MHPMQQTLGRLVLLAFAVAPAFSLHQPPASRTEAALRDTAAASSSDPLPLLIWHGLGDAFDADGIESISDFASSVNPGTFVYAIRLADSGASDRRATFFGNTTEQISQVCEDLASHPVLSVVPAVNALGFSQGGQFLRAYIERCNNPPVRNLVTFGSQHNGIQEFQSCDATDWLCKGAQGLLRSSTWSSLAQGGLVPAQYFRDPEDLEKYLEHSNFLADVNNERKKKNKSYRKNLMTLNKFVMFLFDEDVTVVPKESAWFAEVNRTSGEVTDLRNRTMYKEDWLGLKELDEKGGLVFDSTPGRHMELSDDVLRHVFETYFGPEESAPADVHAEVSPENCAQKFDEGVQKVMDEL